VIGVVGRRSRNNRLDFGGDPDNDPDPGISCRICAADCIKSVLFARWQQAALVLAEFCALQAFLVSVILL